MGCRALSETHSAVVLSLANPQLFTLVFIGGTICLRFRLEVWSEAAMKDDAWLNGEMMPAHCISAATVIRECVKQEWSLQLQDSSTPVSSIDAPALHLPCFFSATCRNCPNCRWTYPEVCVVGGAWGRRVAIRTDEIQLKKCPDDGGGGLANGTGPASPSLRTGMSAPGPQADRA
ncbi:hypothetical protein GE21DRAFT_1276746 [Neurospora crassa]|nr:hypothetical protein GE21DRAFT_1276746 [Neurospora crassa]